MRLDDKEILDILSEIDKLARNLDERMTEVIRRAEEGCIEMQTSMANLHQRINTLRERWQPQKRCGHSKQGDNCDPPPLLKEGGEPVIQK